MKSEIQQVIYFDGGTTGFDIHAYTLIKTGSSSIASDYKVIANHTKTS